MSSIGRARLQFVRSLPHTLHSSTVDFMSYSREREHSGNVWNSSQDTLTVGVVSCVLRSQAIGQLQQKSLTTCQPSMSG